MKLKSVVAILLIYNLSTLACEAPLDKVLNTLKADPVKLNLFLSQFPKGGDLHSHLPGAVYAEELIHAGKGTPFCIEAQSFVAKHDGHCKKPLTFLEIRKRPKLFEKIIEAWSMKNFNFKDGNGHDHMFGTFEKFGELALAERPVALADVVRRAAENNVHYLELMDTLDNNAAAELADHITYTPDFDKLYDTLMQDKIFDLISPTSKRISLMLEDFQKSLKCQNIPEPAGCRLPVNFLYQVLREQAPQKVFASLMFGFKLAQLNPHVVGINLVQPEDGPISMRDYALHMQMVAYLKQLFPNVKVSLHAGELNHALVDDKGLSFHIYDAVMVANADRIGHGVDIQHEHDLDNLLKTMRDREILVEINLSSNDQILGIRGNKHPLNFYLKNRVPVALSTDDEGVLRTDISREYERAVLEHHLDYCQLKLLSRNALSYSFIPGDSLWQKDKLHPACSKDELESNHPNASCRKFLNHSAKAREQWRLEKSFTDFEKHYLDS